MKEDLNLLVVTSGVGISLNIVADNHGCAAMVEVSRAYVFADVEINSTSLFDNPD